MSDKPLSFRYISDTAVMKDVKVTAYRERAYCPVHMIELRQVPQMGSWDGYHHWIYKCPTCDFQQELPEKFPRIIFKEDFE